MENATTEQEKFRQAKARLGRKRDSEGIFMLDERTGVLSRADPLPFLSSLAP